MDRNDWDDIYLDAESNGEGDARAMVRYAYEAGAKSTCTDELLATLRRIAMGAPGVQAGTATADDLRRIASYAIAAHANRERAL